MRPSAGLGLVCLAALPAGCGTTATITRADGMMMEGRIEGGTPDSIIVQPKYGPETEVPRSAIVDIDHPGNVHATVGGITLGFGIWYLVAAAPDCETGSRTECYFGLSVPAVTGAALLTWGLATWIGSSSAADDLTMKPLPRTKPRLPPPSVVPLPEPPLAPPPPPPPGAARAPAPGPPSSAPAPASTPAPAPAPAPASEASPVW